MSHPKQSNWSVKLYWWQLCSHMACLQAGYNLTYANKTRIIAIWLKESGLKVNEEKTELCLFYKKDTHPVEIIFNNVIVKSIPYMNVLGVCFESKLTWSMQEKRGDSNCKTKQNKTNLTNNWTIGQLDKFQTLWFKSIYNLKSHF